MQVLKKPKGGLNLEIILFEANMMEISGIKKTEIEGKKLLVIPMLPSEMRRIERYFCIISQEA
jgi:hypothetical protein